MPTGERVRKKEEEARMILRSPHPDVEIPDVSLPGFVLSRARELGDKPALIDGPSGRVLTYERLAADVGRAAAGLAERGFGKGDVFAIHSPNVPEYAVAFLAVASVGGAVTTVNPLCTADELAGQLRDSGASYLLTAPPFLGTARAAADAVGMREVLVFGEAEEATPFAALLAGDGPAPAVAIDPREDVVALLYSSGTTGRPKGVMLTHRNLVASLCQSDGLGLTREDDTVPAVAPFSHISGLVLTMLMSLYKGATIVTMPRFDLEGFLRLVQDHRVTLGYLVPPIVLALARHPIVDRYDLSSLRCIAAGAAPLGAEVERGCAERLGVPVLKQFGMTETSGLVSATPADDPAKVKPGSVGPLVRNTEGRIVDPATGENLAAGEEGELQVRGLQVMKGYLNRPEATASAIDADGWLRTGDLCRADEDGYLYVVDRLKELIKYKGWQVAPAELEALLLSHPKVADAAVIGSPDEEAGELPKAFVVPEGKPTAEEILSFVVARVAPYKKIRKVEFVGEIPKSPSGKILRRVLIERERQVVGKSGRKNLRPV
jgi:acyl-CoA synthetase (AMP-forming)/AMP-acid ligase II